MRPDRSLKILPIKFNGKLARMVTLVRAGVFRLGADFTAKRRFCLFQHSVLFVYTGYILILTWMTIKVVRSPQVHGTAKPALG